MYRPDDWEKTLREILDCFKVTYMNSDECKLIEAGADAMLEALKAKGSYLNGDTIIPAQGDFPEIHCPGGMIGHVIFIPEVEL